MALLDVALRCSKSAAMRSIASACDGRVGDGRYRGRSGGNWTLLKAARNPASDIHEPLVDLSKMRPRPESGNTGTFRGWSGQTGFDCPEGSTIIVVLSLAAT